MSQEEEPNAVPSSWTRYIVIAALLSGAGNGASFLTTDTSDRYHADTARADFSYRDSRLRELERMQHEHTEHAAKYTQIIDDLRRRVERHLDSDHP